jgi:hypothetical protein
VFKGLRTVAVVSYAHMLQPVSKLFLLHNLAVEAYAQPLTYMGKA